MTTAAAAAALCMSSQSPIALGSHETALGNLGRSSVSVLPLKKKMIKSRACVGCRLTSTAPTRHSILPSHWSVPVRVAHELLQAGHHFLDVRSPQEFSAGHVLGAVNVPFLITLPASEVMMNPYFIQQVSSLFDKDDEILIGCQTGNVSLLAVHQLLSARFTGVLHVAGGYDAWIQGELPAQL
ncbi:hypothetical protein vseg_005023 [Gypsophila vaccaria]